MIERLDGESQLNFMKRIVYGKLVDKTIDLQFEDLSEPLFGEGNCFNESEVRKRMYGMLRIFNVLGDSHNITEDELLAELENRKFEIQKERKKLQVVNSLYQENARLEGRFELYLEQIDNSIKNLKPISIPAFNKKEFSSGGTGCLFISDAHYGRVAEILDLDNNIINKYNPEEFEKRMWSLLDQLEEDQKFSMYNRLKISDCGDTIEGVLRSGSSLLNLKYGNVDSTIKYSEFMSTWLCACSARLGIPVEYSLVGGNHELLRILEQKAQFEEENMAKIIVKFISERVECEKLRYKVRGDVLQLSVKPYNAVCYDDFYGLKVMSYHGESKSMKTDINFFENLFNVKIDLLCAGHLHHGYEEDVGIGDFGNKSVVRLPSICGIDDFSIKVRQVSRAGAKFINFTENGRSFEKTYWLS